MNADGRRDLTMVQVVTLEVRPIFLCVYQRESAVKDTYAGIRDRMNSLTGSHLPLNCRPSLNFERINHD